MKLFDKCIICGNSDFEIIYKKKWESSNFNKCRRCKLIFQNPQEDIYKTKSRYDQSYFDYERNNEYAFFNLIKKTLDDYDVFSYLDKGSKVLEIGSATGLFLQYMNQLGYVSKGIEVCKESCEYGKKNYNVDIFNGILDDFSTDIKYDFIHFSHLIEHLNDPVSFLKRVNDLLTDNGIVLITTPNSGGLFSKFFNNDWRCIVDDHLFLFNIDNFNMLLNDTGFDVISTLTWGSIPAGSKLKIFKKIADNYVKKSGNGDVMSFLVKKNNK